MSPCCRATSGGSLRGARVGGPSGPFSAAGTAERNSFVIRKSREYLHDSMRAMYAAEPGRFFFATDEGEPLAAIFVFTFGQRARHKVLRYGIAGPRPENLDEEDPLWGVYRFKVGFGGETTNFLGCLDLPLKEVCAAAWYRFEPAYHQLY